MSENTELKLPKNYKRPSLAEFTSAGHGYKAENYESFFGKLESELAAQYASGAVTDESFVDIRDPDFTDEMTDADHDGLPDVLHVRSQVRAIANRTQRARYPTRHRFKQYLFSDPSKRLVRKRPLRVSTALVLTNLDELLDKEAAGILSVHTPNGQRVDLKALKAGRVELSAPIPTPALPNPPLDSAANDTPAGEHLQQYLGGTYVNDPAADEIVEEMMAEKAAEVAKKEREPKDGQGEEVDPAATEVISRGDTSVGAGLSEITASPGEAVGPTEETPVVAEEQDRSAIDPAADTELQTPAINAGDDESPITDEARDPADEAPKASSSKKSGKKGSHK